MRHFLNISDLSSQFLREIIEEAKIRKSKRRDLNKSAADFDQILAGKSMIMIFEKPSTRTRISFDIAAKQLGGSTIILNQDLNIVFWTNQIDPTSNVEALGMVLYTYYV